MDTIGKSNGTAKVNNVPVNKVTKLNLIPTNFVIGASIVSIFPDAPPAMGVPGLILISNGIKSRVINSRITFTIKP